jgi:predicted DNA-binding protein (MmcQ/YjbR family)
MMLSLNRIKGWCEALPGALEDMPFGSDVLVYKVAGKIFALIGLSHTHLHLSLKYDPLMAEDLRRLYPSITAGYHLNKRHWNTLILDASLPDELVYQQLQASYHLVFNSLPKAVRKSL